jgi:type II secretory pathway pseudopilin PulG
VAWDDSNINCMINMAILQFLLAIGLAGFVGLLVANNLQESKQKKQLDEAFYQLLETQNSQVSLIQLAASARVEARIAQQYLDKQVKIFSAVLEVDEDGDTFYRFPRLRLPPSSRQEW